MLIVDKKKLAALLDEVKVIAVIGAVDKPGRPVDRVCRYMIDAGYQIIPVHPKRQDVWGLKTYKSVTDIPVPVDLVNLFRASEFCAGHAREVLELEKHAQMLLDAGRYFQPGSTGAASGNNITVIEDRCIMVDHINLAGKKIMSKAFECRMCGHCCQGEGGIIMTAKDRTRLAGHLGISEQDLIEKHSETVNGKIRLQSREDGYCVFYNEGCGVHPGRPDICRAWPFFRGNLIDEMSWEMIQEYCPGVNKEAGHAGFVKEGKQYIRDEGLRQHDPDVAPNALITDED